MKITNDIDIVKNCSKLFAVRILEDIPSGELMQLHRMAQLEWLNLNQYIQKYYDCLLNKTKLIQTIPVKEFKFTFTVRSRVNNEIMFTCTCEEKEIAVAEKQDGLVFIYVAPHKTSKFPNHEGVYLYDLEMVQGDKVYTVVKGNFTVYRKITVRDF